MSSESFESAAVAFKTKTGEIIFIGKEDIKKMSDEFWLQIVLNKRTHVIIPKDMAIEKAKFIYEVYQNEKKEMPDDVKVEYFSAILSYLKNPILEIGTLEEMVKNKLT